MPGGSNQSIGELRADYRLSAEERLAQAAQLSEIATEQAAGRAQDNVDIESLKAARAEL